MKIINIQAAKTHLSRIVDRAAAGEEIILAKAGKPLVKIIPYTTARKPRIGGQLNGKIWESNDAWAADADLDSEMTQAPLYPITHDASDQRVAEDPS